MRRSMLSIVRLAGILMLLLPVAMGQARQTTPTSQTLPTHQPDGRSRPAPTIRSASDAAAERLGSDLAKLARSGSTQLVKVTIVTVGSVNLQGIATRWRATTVALDEGRTIAALVPANRLIKLASLPGVAAILPPASTPSPTGYEAHRAPIQPGKVGGQLWYARRAIGADRANANGYDGNGVIVGIEDQGADFGHPDLQGTFARDPNPASPYYGFPLIYDDVSATSYALSGGDPTGTYYAASKATFTATAAAGQVGTITIAVPAFKQPAGSATTVNHTITYRNTSKSGKIHFGVHPDSTLWRTETIGGATYVVPAVFLVVDEAKAGKYDTVYVDLGHQGAAPFTVDATYDFSTVRAARLGPGKDPTIAEDLNGDAVDDLSGGLIYFIADGTHHVPVLDWLWDANGTTNPANKITPPKAGELVAFYGAFDGFSHGTGVASQIVGQGIINSRFGQVGNTPPLTGATDGDTVVGGVIPGFARGAKIFATGPNLGLPNHWVAMARGYDGVRNTGDDAQVINNSWGYSAIPPTTELLDFYSTLYNAPQRSPRTLFVVSAGNGGQGYTTTASPSMGGTVLSVGASTQYGSDDVTAIISDVNQITSGDPATFTSRGPDFRGRSGVALTAVGSSATGAVPLNISVDPHTGAFNGNNAWEEFGGTSQAGPQAVAVAALVFQAYKERTGTFPTWDVARSLLQFGADDMHEDPAIQGAGQANADFATAAAGGLYGAILSNPTQPVTLTSSEWEVGDYRGTRYLDFPNIAQRGGNYTRTFQLTNPSPRPVTLNLAGDLLTRVGSQDLTVDTKLKDESPQETEQLARSPDYLITPDKLKIPAGTDMMQVQLAQDFENFCTQDPASPHLDCGRRGQNAFYLRAYAWTDLNGNGKLWTDKNGNGVVNDGELDLPATSVLDGSPLPRVSHEVNALNEATISGNSQDLRIARPLDRDGNGLLLGLTHRIRSTAIPTATIRLKVSYFKHQPWSLLTLNKSSVTLAPGASTTFNATVKVPSDASYGFREGSIRVTTTIAGNQQAGVRFLHAATGVGAIDVYVDGNKVATNLAFNDNSLAYINLAGGDHRVQIAPTGQGIAKSVINQSVRLVGGTEYTLAAVENGTGAASSGATVEVIVDSNLAPAVGKTKVRFGQLSPNIGAVDVYADGNRILANLEYRAVSDFLLLDAGMHTFTVTRAGQATALITIGPTVILPATNESIYATGLSGGTPVLSGKVVNGLVRTHFPSHTSTIPVVVNVAANSALKTSVHFGADDITKTVPESKSVFDTSRVQGLVDWRGNGHEEQGDWRSFFVDVPTQPVTDTQFIMHSAWSDMPTDIDLLAAGPSPHVNPALDPAVFGPNDLAVVARTQSTWHDADGVGATPGESYSFRTGTGGTSEWLTGPLSQGLQSFFMHNVLYGGRLAGGVPFSSDLGSALVSPQTISDTAAQASGSFPIHFSSSLSLPGLDAAAYGLSPTRTYSDTVGQSNPPGDLTDPNGNKLYDFTVGNSGLLDISTTPNANFTGYDIDIFLQRKEGNAFVTIAQSTGGTADEAISVLLPEPGDYRVLLNGFDVPPGASYTLTIANAEGNDLQISGVPTTPIAANTPVTLTVSYTAGFIGKRQGIVFFGPKGAPTAFRVPITLVGTRAFVFLPVVNP